MLNTRLKNLRLAKGLTLQQVGDVFGISKASVSSWESGKSHPDHKKLEKLSELFGTSVQFLISGTSDNSTNLQSKVDVPFCPWDRLGSMPIDLQTSEVRVMPLHSKPSSNAFATRYPGSIEHSWQFNGIPAGSVLVVDPDIVPGPIDTVIVKLKDGSICLAKYQQTPENKKFLASADKANFEPLPSQSIKVIGVALEWQLTGKLT
jgi:transcriptional regulator with XRE-family HTH domain